jgi:hypothetical protein
MMTAFTASEQHAHEQRSAVLVLLTTAIALLLGWGIMTAVTTAANTVTRDGITAEAPAGWLVQDGAGTLILVVRNPRDLDELYRVLHMHADADLEAMATMRNNNRALQETAFHILETTPIVFDGRDGFKVNYAYADTDNTKPQIIEGVDYYFPEGDDVLLISFEAESETFAADFPRFIRFLRSVSVTGGS